MNSAHKVTILNGGEDTLRSVARVHEAAFSEQGGQVWDFTAFKSLISMPGSLLLGVYADNNLIGFLLVRSVADEAEIITLAVLPVYQRTGVARALLDAMKQMLRKEGVCFVYLEVMEDNISAIKLYNICGFMKTGTRKEYYKKESGKKMDAFVFSLRLNTINNS